MAWAALVDGIPLYPLYALLFADHGMSDAQISGLFVVWAVVSLAAEIPTGALADHVSRRTLLAWCGVLQAAGFAAWTAWPTPAGFVAGFVLWGIGGAFFSGTTEALLYDTLAVAGDADAYARVRGRVAAAGLAAQVPAGLAAAPLYALGGYALVGWVSVAVSLGAAALARGLPDHRPPDAGGDEDEPGYVEALREGVREAVGSAAVRGALVASAGLLSLEALEEYDVLLAREWGVPTGWVPLAVVWLPLAGALGAAVAGRLSGARMPVLAAALGAGVALVAAAAVARVPYGVLAIAAFYGVFRAVRVVVDMRLQHRITGSARATVTSTAEFAGGVLGIGAFGLWALWGVWGLLALATVVVAALPWLVRPGPGRDVPRGSSLRRGGRDSL